MVCLMLAIHQCAPKQAKPFTLVALGWMLAAAAFTIVVHFVELTVARHIDPATFPGYARIFGWQWQDGLQAPCDRRWCDRYLSARPARVLFRSGHLSQVIATEFADGRRVVIKGRPFVPRIAGCVAVQTHLVRAGHRVPCP
jgi:hypothetical protein